MVLCSVVVLTAKAVISFLNERLSRGRKLLTFVGQYPEVVLLVVFVASWSSSSSSSSLRHHSSPRWSSSPMYCFLKTNALSITKLRSRALRFPRLFFKFRKPCLHHSGPCIAMSGPEAPNYAHYRRPEPDKSSEKLPTKDGRLASPRAS